MLHASPIAPAWIVLPLGLLAAVTIAGHLMDLREATRRGDVPASRWRIRSCNGMVMLLTVPLAAYAFGVATPARPGAFMLAWTSVTGLLGIVLLLASMDMLNTWRLLRRQRQHDLRQIRQARRALLEQAVSLARARSADRLRLGHDEPGESADR
ncbi:MAG: hypothetical protein ACIARR_05220 [Phycisphaerales bacterium JB059]